MGKTRQCKDCLEWKPIVEFRYPNQQRITNYAKRCEWCRSLPAKVKCVRCGEYKTHSDFRELPRGGRSRTCHACFGAEGNHISVSVRAVHQMLDEAGIPDCNRALEARVKALIDTAKAAQSMERKALRIAIPLIHERYERRRKNNTVRQMLESEDV